MYNKNTFSFGTECHNTEFHIRKVQYCTICPQSYVSYCYYYYCKTLLWLTTYSLSVLQLLRDNEDRWLWWADYPRALTVMRTVTVACPGGMTPPWSTASTWKV